MPSERPLDQQRWVECENVGSQAIPSWGVVEITGVVNTDGQRMVLQVRRPTADNRTTVAVNFISPIAVGGFGKCTLSMPTFAVYDTSNSPANGEEWGTQANLFTLKKDNTGFLIHGGLLGSGATSRVEVQRAFGTASDDAKIGKTDSSIAKLSGSTMTGGTVSVYEATGGSLSDSGSDVTAFNASDAEIASGVFVMVHKESETGEWIAVAINTSLFTLAGTTGSELILAGDTVTMAVENTDKGPTGFAVVRTGASDVLNAITMAFEHITALVTADFTASDAVLTGSFPVDGVTTLIGKLAVDADMTTGTVLNSIGASGSDNDRVFLSYDHTASIAAGADRWEITTPPPGLISWTAEATSGAQVITNDTVSVRWVGSNGITTSIGEAAGVVTITTALVDPIFSIASSPNTEEVDYGETITFTDSSSIDFTVSTGRVITASIIDPIFTINPTSGSSVPVSHDETINFVVTGSGLTITGNGSDTLTFDSSGGGDWIANADSGGPLTISSGDTVDFEGGSAKTASSTNLIKTTVTDLGGGSKRLDIEGDISIATKRIFTASSSGIGNGEVSGDTTVEVEDNAEQWEASWGTKFNTAAGTGITGVESHGIWARAQANSSDGDSVLIRLVEDKNGGDLAATTYTCYVRSGTGTGGNNIRSGEIIIVHRMRDGDVANTFATSAGASLPIGSVIQWVLPHSPGGPSGWELMDGTANSSGSGLDLRSKFIKGRPSGTGAINGTTHTGGNANHSHDDHDTHTHPIPDAANISYTIGGTTHTPRAANTSTEASALDHSSESNDPEFQGIYYFERIN